MRPSILIPMLVVAAMGGGCGAAPEGDDASAAGQRQTVDPDAPASESVEARRQEMVAKLAGAKLVITTEVSFIGHNTGNFFFRNPARGFNCGFVLQHTLPFGGGDKLPVKSEWRIDSAHIEASEPKPGNGVEDFDFPLRSDDTSPGNSGQAANLTLRCNPLPKIGPTFDFAALKRSFDEDPSKVGTLVLAH